MEDQIKVAYLHFAGKLPRKYEDKAIMSVALCTDYLGYYLVTKKVEAVDAETTNNKWIDVQALDYALDFLFRIQSDLIAQGVSRVFLVTDNPNLYTYLVDKPLSKTIKTWLDVIYKNYSVFGPKELKLGIGMCKLCDRNRAKTYYFEKFVENESYLTEKPEHEIVMHEDGEAEKKIKRKPKKHVFSGLDNLITAADLLKEAEVDGVADIEELK